MSPFATYIVETFVTLIAVVALAVVVLVGARRFGLGRPLGPLELLGRLPLEGRRAVYLVRVMDRAYVLFASEAGLEKIGELAASEVAAGAPPQASFGQVLAKVLQRKQSESSRMMTGEDDHATR